MHLRPGGAEPDQPAGADPELVLAPATGLRVSWPGRRVVLPADPAVDRWKIAAHGAKLRLAYRGRAGWRWWGGLLPASVSVVSLLLFRGRPATTEYSASNGGWSASGGVPYLVSRADPYRAGDPHRSWRLRVRVVDLGRKFGFSRLDRLRVLRRTGRGDWGGRVLRVELTGLDGVGKPRAVTVTGGRLRSALGAKSSYLRVREG